MRHLKRLGRARILSSVGFFLVGVPCILAYANALIFFALIPLISVISQNTLNTKAFVHDVFWGSALLCLISYFFLFHAKAESNNIILENAFGSLSWIVVWLIIFWLSLFCALAFVPMAYILCQIHDPRWRLVSFPLLWPLGELFRSYLFALASYGPGSTLGPYYNWGSLSITASGTALVYLSRYLGFFGLSLAVVVVNISLFMLFNGKQRVLALFFLSGILLATSIAWTRGISSSSQKTVLVGAVHMSDFGKTSRWKDPLHFSEQFDLLALPEYSGAHTPDDFRHIGNTLRPQGVGVSTITRGNNKNLRNSMVFFDKQGGVIAIQDKNFIIPTGETLPYSLRVLFVLLGSKGLIMDFEKSQQIIPGSQPEEVVSHGELRIGALACSGMLSPFAYERLAQQGANILVNSASFQFLSAHFLYHIQANNMARYHAVRNNLPFVQSSVGGESFLIDNQGRLLSRAYEDKDMLLSSAIRISRARSPHHGT